MRTHRSQPEGGSALILALIAFVIVAGAGAAIFSLTLKGHQTTFKASNADVAFHVAEAGLDDALNKMAAYAARPNLTNADFAVIGMTKFDNGMAVNLIEGSINRAGSFRVTIDPPYAGVGTYRIRSVGTYNNERRAIETYAVAFNKPASFKYGLFGDVTVDAGGSLITDGFQSSVGTYTSQAINPWKGGKVMYANQTGNLGSNGNIDVSGSALIFGNATPGPDNSVTGGGYVAGSTAPATEQFPVTPPEFAPPKPTPPPIPSSTPPAGEYYVDSLNLGSKDVLTIDGDVTIYVKGDIKITAQAQINITSNGKLTIYQDANTTLDVTGGSNTNKGGVGNSSGIAANFQIWSGAKTATINGGAGYIGAVYAPGADVKLNGNAEYFGGVVGKTIKPIGNAYFHYDEDLAKITIPKIIIQMKSTRQYVP